MRVTRDEVVTAFEDLLCGARSRENVADWASRLMRGAGDDVGGLQYEPLSAEAAIWSALVYLSGVDLKDGPTSYLHTLQDFEMYWSSKKLDLH